MSDEKRQEAWEAAWGRHHYSLPAPIRSPFFDWGYDAARAAEPDGLREALRFYADGENWERGAAPSAIDFDEGRKARRALGVADRQYYPLRTPPHDHGNATGSSCIVGESACDYFNRVADSPPEEPSDAD